MGVKFSNNGHSTLAASLASNATSITVASGHGARFPSLSSGEFFYATLIDASNNLEIVKITGRSSDVLTATRAQESTTARAYAIGDRIELRVTAAGIADATNIDNIVPSQSGNSGKFLKTDGTNVSFDDAGSTSATDLTSGTLPSARLPAGTVLQVVVVTTAATVAVNNTTAKIIEGSITTKQASSKLFASVNLAIGGVSSYTDTDLALSLAFKTGSASGTSSDYTSMNSSSFSRQGISGLDTWYAADTMRGSSTGDQYWCETKTHSALSTTSIAAGTTVQVANWASTNANYNFGSSVPAYSDSGSEQSLVIMEVAT
mgnify:CR=1 FL=1